MPAAPKSPPRPSRRAVSPSILLVGTFDGVHLGHQALLRRAAELASRAPGLRPRILALAFDPSPLEVLRPDAAPARLTSFDTRRELLLACGADEVLRLKPTPDLLALSPTDFIDLLLRDHALRGIVEGPDFRFGRAREGDISLLTRLGRERNFAVEIVDQVEIALTDHTIVPARSSTVRWLLEHGRVRDAALGLGRPYAMHGLVVRGDRRGRTIGFPTANLDSPCVAPADGVYAGLARLADGRECPAAISVGTKPTFGEHARAVEAVLMGDGLWAPPQPSAPAHAVKPWHKLPGLPEYGWPLELRFIAWVRDQLRFASLESLLDQMTRDCARIHAIIANEREASRQARPQPQPQPQPQEAMR